MNIEEIAQRLADLHNVLWYCSDLQKEGRIYVFKVGERIAINQERGALFTQLSLLHNQIFPHEARFYKCPPELESKINFTIQKIQSTNWGGFNENQFIK